MGKIKNQSGFTIVEASLVLIFLALVVLIGLYVAHTHNVKTTAATTQTTTKSAATTSKPTQPADPYTSWKSASLTYEKISFKYPSTWTVKDQSVAAHDPSLGNDSPMDAVFLTSPTGNEISLDTGTLAKESPITFDKVSINFLGTSTDLLVAAIPDQSSSMPTQPTEALINYTSKNITTPCYRGSTQSCPTYDNFTYLPNGNATAMSVNQMESNPDFTTAKLVFESMKY